MKIKKRWRKPLGWAAVFVVAALGFVWATNRAVLGAADGKIYSRVEDVPGRSIALVLGTSPSIQGRKNLFFERRMDAASALFKAGRVSKLLVSGDHGTRYYDEPDAMRKALVARGVPEKDIVMDFAGFRTLDSIVRARLVFGVQRCIIVTDDFHLPRALYIAENSHLDAIGYQTEPLPRSFSPWTYVREMGARSLVWVDLHLLNRQPRFLGPRQQI